jgi:protein phosphatase 2C family protein 2/3
MSQRKSFGSAQPAVTSITDVLTVIRTPCALNVLILTQGNLALSRALGDFEFKQNASLGPEQQIITADPEITCHEINEEDEFLVLACDGLSYVRNHSEISHVFLGIWDCLTSQQVVDIIRYQVSEGKELSEITEMMCDHCLAPDTSSRLGIGCDNMTILIVALLHGRTKEEWYSWITDRVKNRIGYETPDCPPQLYSPSRIKSFHERQEAIEASEKRQKESSDRHDDHALGLARFLSSHGVGGSIHTFHIGGDKKNNVAYSWDGQPQPKRLDAQTNESQHDMDDDETHLDESGEVTSPINDDLKSSDTPVEQLPSQLGGDAPPSVAKIEGSLDSSEDPFKN